MVQNGVIDWKMLFRCAARIIGRSSGAVRLTNIKASAEPFITSELLQEYWTAVPWCREVLGKLSSLDLFPRIDEKNATEGRIGTILSGVHVPGSVALQAS